MVKAKLHILMSGKPLFVSVLMNAYCIYIGLVYLAPHVLNSYLTPMAERRPAEENYGAWLREE